MEEADSREKNPDARSDEVSSWRKRILGRRIRANSREKNPRKATRVQPTRSNGLQGRFYLAWRPPSRRDCMPCSAGYHSTTRPRETCGVSLIAEEMPKVDNYRVRPLWTCVSISPGESSEMIMATEDVLSVLSPPTTSSQE
jgi:hypothetical protein